MRSNPLNTRCRRPRNRHARRGATMVEGAIVLSVMLFLVIGGLDLGLTVARYNNLAEAARRGARAAAIRGSKATAIGALGPVEMSFAADSSNAIATAIRGVLLAMDPSAVKVTVTWPDTTNTTGDEVWVNVQCPKNTICQSLLGFSNGTLQSTAVVSIVH